MAANDCASCNGSCNNPNALEYGKCFKPENNNGCDCNCAGNFGNGEEETDETCTIVRNSFSRTDFIG